MVKRIIKALLSFEKIISNYSLQTLKVTIKIEKDKQGKPKNK